MKNFNNGNIIEAKTYFIVLGREVGVSNRIRVHSVNNETKYYNLKLF